MFHRLINENSKAMIESAERLSEFALRTFNEFPGTDREDAHIKAILVTHMASRLLQLTYSGKSTIESISNEADRLLSAVSGKNGDA